MKLKKLLNKDRLINFGVFFVCFILFSVVYFILPMDVYKGEFISDSSFVSIIVKDGHSFIDFFETNSFYGRFLNNLLVFINTSSFNYSLIYIKITNYVVTTLTYIVAYIFFLDAKATKTKVFSLLFLVLISTNFFSFYDSCSLIDAKLLILVSLVSILLIKYSKETQNEITKVVLLSISAFLQVFAFFLPMVFVYAYFIIKNRPKGKILKILNYSIPSILVLAAAGLNYKVFLSLGLDKGFDFVLFFSSFVMPINRIVPTDHAATFNLACSIAGLVVLVVLLINELLHKRFYFAGLFVFLVLLEAFSYQRYGYHLSKLFQINAVVISYLAYRLISDDKLEYSFFKKHNGRFFSNIKTGLEDVGEVFKKATPLLVGLIYIVTSGVAVSILEEHKAIKDGSVDVFDYIQKYDEGYLDEEPSYYFDVDKNIFDSTLNPYIEGGYISQGNATLEADELTDNLKNLIIHRGIRKDDLNEYWLSNNFAFETYCTNRYMSLSLYSIVSDSELTIYCNNNCVGTYTIGRETNFVSFDVKEFIGQQVVIRGTFSKTTYGPFENDGRYACEINKLAFSNTYGIYESGTDKSLWCNKEIGFYYPEASINKIYSFYAPGNETSNCNIYINDRLVKQRLFKGGMNEVMINLVEYYGEEVLVRFDFEKKLSFKIDNQPVYCKYEGVVSNKNDGFYPADNDGQIWCNDDFTFYYDEEKYTGDNRYRTYKFFVPNGVEDNPTQIYVNGEKISDAILINGINEIFVDLYKFKGQFVNVRFKTDNYIHSTTDNREKTCIFLGETNGDTYGIYSFKSGRDMWCNKEFAFFYRNLEMDKHYRSYSLYIPDAAEANELNVFANDTLIKTQTLVGGVNEVNLGLTAFLSQDVEIKFVFDHVLGGTSDIRYRACLYLGFKDVNEYGSYPLSTGDTSAWMKKEFTFYYENLQTSGRYRNYSFYVPDGAPENPLDVYVNDTLVLSSSLRGGMNQVRVDMNQYKGTDVEVKFVLENSLSASGADRRERSCVYLGYSDSNTYGLYPASSGEEPWCSKELAFNYENFSSEHRYRRYLFYTHDFAPDNPYKVYVNNVLVKEGVLHGNSNEIALDLSSYQGTDIEVKFIFDFALTGLTDPRELVAVYLGYRDSDRFGFYDQDSFCRLNFGLSLENVSSNVRFKLYIPDALPDSPIKAYVNGVMVLDTALHGGMNTIDIDLSSFAGQDVGLTFTVENKIDGGADRRELACVYCGMTEIPFA